MVVRIQLGTLPLPGGPISSLLLPDVTEGKETNKPKLNKLKQTPVKTTIVLIF